MFKIPAAKMIIPSYIRIFCILIPLIICQYALATHNKSTDAFIKCNDAATEHGMKVSLRGMLIFIATINLISVVCELGLLIFCYLFGFGMQARDIIINTLFFVVPFNIFDFAWCIYSAVILAKIHKQCNHNAPGIYGITCVSIVILFLNILFTILKMRVK